MPVPTLRYPLFIIPTDQYKVVETEGERGRARMEAHRHRIIITATAVAAFMFWSGLAAPSPAEFIQSSCKVTQYPDLCVKYLSGYGPSVQRSPRKLARAALIMTSEHALNVSNYVRSVSVNGKPPSSTARDGGAVRDCRETLGDTVDRLRRSAEEMGLMGRYGSGSFKWHLSNAQTWVSAALTDQNTCLDSLRQDKSAAGVRPEISLRIAGVSKLTSNALALVNWLDS